MKKLLCMLAMLLLAPVMTVQAAVYQNIQYNFQLTFPDGWMDADSAPQEVLFGKVLRDGTMVSAFAMNADLDQEIAGLLATATREEKLEGLTYFVQQLSSQFPDKHMSQPRVLDMGNDDITALVVALAPKQEQLDEPVLNMLIVPFIDDKTIYYAFFATNDTSGQQMAEFFTILRTFQPLQ